MIDLKWIQSLGCAHAALVAAAEVVHALADEFVEEGDLHVAERVRQAADEIDVLVEAYGPNALGGAW